MPLDTGVAERLIQWFATEPPPWAGDNDLPPRAPVVLAFVAARGAGYAPKEVGSAFKYAEDTVRTYHRDFAAYCGTTNGGLGRLALLDLTKRNPELLADLLS